MNKVSGKISDILEILKGLKDVIRKEYNAEVIGVFGSYARGEEKGNSDIDILVRFFEGATLFDFAGLADFLEEQLKIKVDLVSDRAIREEIKEPILTEVMRI